MRSLKPFLDEELPSALDALHEQFRTHPETRAAFRDSGLVEQSRSAHRRHWDGVANGDYDDRYLATVAAIARTQAKAGLEPHWYNRRLRVMADQLVRAMIRRTWPKPGLFRDKSAPTAEQVAEGMAALVKALILDADLVSAVLNEGDAESQAKTEQAVIDQQQAVVAGSIGVGLESWPKGPDVPADGRPATHYEKLRGDFNAAIANLQETVSVIGRNTQAIRAGSNEISEAADDLSRRTEQQAASLEQTAAALDQITATVRKTADGADHARDVVGKAKADAERGGVVCAKPSPHERDRILLQQGHPDHRVIDEIAFQTNLLA